MSTSRRVLIVGGGGREHALAVALSRGGHHIVVSPGNAGIARDHTCQEAPEGPVALAQALQADSAAIRAEAPLVAGLADEAQAAGLYALGPRRGAAQIEGSKVFMKELCREAAVPTAEFAVFEDAAAAAAWLAGRPGGWVVKADGLCAGKGVTVCATAEEASAEAGRMLGGAFGEASGRIIVEGFLPGVELSVLGLCDGDDALLFGPARDHKALLDGGEGPNTGGMGAVAPLGEAQGVSDALLERVRREIFLPILATLKARGAPYTGILYAGLMIDAGEPSVLEFNCRFGDPEAQAVLLGTDVDLTALLYEVASGQGLPETRPDLARACRPTCAVVLASEGYPASPKRGRPISLPGHVGAGDQIFFAGVKPEGDQLVTDGGRVLAATSSRATLTEAIDAAYALAEQIGFEGQQRRGDIGEVYASKNQDHGGHDAVV